MKVINNYILLEIDERTNNKVVAPGGMVFYTDPSWAPQHHVKMDHKVAATPSVAYSLWDGLHPLDTVEIELNFKKGDRVYVGYREIENDSNMVFIDRQYARVRAAEVFAVVDDSELGFRAAGEWAIIKPGVKDCSLPSSALITPDHLKEQKDNTWGTIVSLGPNTTSELSVGDKVYLKREKARANPGFEAHDRETLNALRIGNRLEGESMAFEVYIEGVLYYVQFASTVNFRSVSFRNLARRPRRLHVIDRVTDVSYEEIVAKV